MQIPYRKPGKFTNMIPDPLMTEAKLTELKNKLERLKNAQPQAAAEVSRLAQLGDFSENAEYQMAKGKLRGINNGILLLDRQINVAEIIKPNKDAGTVQLGSTVTIDDGARTRKYQILGSTETNPQKGIISHHSPIGAALFDHKVGDIVMVKMLDKENKYTILGIE